MWMTEHREAYIQEFRNSSWAVIPCALGVGALSFYEPKEWVNWVFTGIYTYFSFSLLFVAYLTIKYSAVYLRHTTYTKKDEPIQYYGSILACVTSVIILISSL